MHHHLLFHGKPKTARWPQYQSISDFGMGLALGSLRYVRAGNPRLCECPLFTLELAVYGKFLNPALLLGEENLKQQDKALKAGTSPENSAERSTGSAEGQQFYCESCRNFQKDGYTGYCRIHHAYVLKSFWCVQYESSQRSLEDVE